MPFQSEPVPIRAHHLLCQFGFRGYGYSDAFVANMKALLERLRAEPETPVVIGETPDAICAAFPPDAPAHCEEARVIIRDRAVLSAIGLTAGATVSWREAVGRVRNVFRPHDLSTLCSTCPWLPAGYCQEGLAAARRPGPT